ncbi:MAG TPA: 16S rRNA (cytosine(1402)-N(4))-methyltransferase RsmH [Chloroflexota bacterium]|nr:16S rRNA (cytosine(1402)-N(4))-methyltransferase RsmH [Chloroflexota bacterium]
MAAVDHVSVLLNEAVEILNPRAGGRYIDGTLGGGGHAAELLERSGPDGRLLGLDLDPEAIERVRQRLARFGDRVILVHDSFANIERVARWEGFAPVDGILLDLGLSSFQLASAERGFGFGIPAPLDMRFNRNGPGPLARDLVNTLSAEALTDILRRYGEEPRARQIARAIVQARARHPIETTAELAQVVERAAHRVGRTHPATRTFQALRIAVNHELEALEKALPEAIEILGPGGRLAIISFHSLEDRIVKHFFRSLANPCTCPPGLPMCVCGKKPTVRVLTRGGVRPTPDEIATNPRSRSATLRAVEKLARDTAPVATPASDDSSDESEPGA